jgi:hypothetical protein
MASKISVWDRIQWNPLIPGAALAWWLWRMNTWEWQMSWFRFIGFVVICAWFLGAVANLLTRGKFLAWMSPDDDEAEFQLPKTLAGFSRRSKATSPLISALHTGVTQPEKMKEALEPFLVKPVESKMDAIAVITAYQELSQIDNPSTAHVMDLFHKPGSQTAYNYFHQIGLPLVHDRLRALKDSPLHEPEFDNEELKAIALLTIYSYSPAFPDICDRAQDPRLVESYMWGRIFSAGDEDNEDFLELLKSLGEKLPCGFASVALLDRCNDLCLNEKLSFHPFSSDAGIQRLEEFIRDKDPEHHSYAVSAASALPHIAHPGVESLLLLGSRHPDPNMVVETAWAGAKMRLEPYILLLTDLTKDWKTGHRAMKFLRELNLENHIPKEALDSRHVATCAVADWLQHPNELTRLPDILEIVDHRTIYWPPSNTQSCVSLIRWTLDEETGIAMTGGTTTWCFLSSDFSDWPPLDIYSQHCNWELRRSQLAGAPKDYSNLSFGRKLLQEMNPLEDWQPQAILHKKLNA